MRSFSGTSLPFVVVTALATTITLAAAGCGQVSQLKGRKSYKDANTAYQAQDYKKAADLYQATIDADPNAKETLPAYFFLANCLDNLYKPSKKGDPANDALMEKAVQYYQMAAEKLNASDSPEYKKLGKLSLQYLVAAYGADKLNDPGKAEPVLQSMIRSDPGDIANYFMLARLYEDAGVYDEAECDERGERAKEPQRIRIADWRREQIAADRRVVGADVIGHEAGRERVRGDGQHGTDDSQGQCCSVAP